MKNFSLVFLLIVLSTSIASAQFRSNRGQSSQLSESTLNYAQPQEYLIAGIEVTGLNILDKNAMISLTGLKVGDKVKIPGDNIANALRKLWKHGLIGDASILVQKIEGGNVFLEINLAERPRLTDFYFTGISKSRQTSLKEDLSLIRGKIVNDATIRNAEVSVKKHFVKKGFLNTVVKIKQEFDTLNRGGVRLNINVDLKSKVKINAVHIVGNEQISESVLKGKLKKTKEHPRITLHRKIIGEAITLTPRKFKAALDSSRHVSWRDIKEFMSEHIKVNVFAGSKFIRSDFEDDKKRMVEYFNSQGFRDAEIVFDTLTRYDDKNIDVLIKVYEGRKYYFRDITWVGNYLHSANTLNKILDIKKGDVYNKELIDKKTTFNPKGADISGLYMDDGYLFFQVVPVEVAVVGDSIDIQMRIREGDQATIDEVIISGNERTNDHVIRRELSTIPGNKFRRSDLIRTQQMLSQMGYFNPQKIDQDIRPNMADGTVDIEWKVEEQSNDQIELSGGWGGFYGFVGTVGLSFNNFSLRNVPNFSKWKPLPVGDGQRLSLRAQANGRSFQSYSLSFTEPWLGGRKPNSLTVSLNRSISRLANQSFEFTDNTSLKQGGITIGLGRRLEWPDNYFLLTNSLSFLQYQYSNYFQSATLPPIGKTNEIMFNTTLSRNSIDNPMYPASGATISLSLSLTPPYSLWRDPSYYDDIDTRYKWTELYKWMFDAKYYIKLIGSSKPDGRSLVLETKMHFGFIGTYNKDLGPGPFQRFMMGGDGLAGGFNSFVLGQEIIGLRGYPNNQVTPPLYALRNQQQLIGIEGGIVYDKFGLELRYPVVTGQSATIYGFLFTEGGNNWNNYQEFNPFDMYKSAGVGARIFMPAFGLIGLNWAYGFDRLPGAPDISGSQFHFTIGQQLR
ncbi:MAG: outer membrane protein assembly factor BamA [Cyclobacteriaceae bacterium]|jgi:outer membrane protein insertion porin family|nr:outer membrane protein assembly factor BamA [Cyclobacteriaceae bacterium]